MEKGNISKPMTCLSLSMAVHSHLISTQLGFGIGMTSREIQVPARVR